MNSFKNQIVNLSASDAIKNKKDRHIYSAAKKQFEVKNFCKKQRNLRYYRNGKVRSVVNYEYGNDLARGNILCNNCDRPDNTCGDIFKQNAQRIDMHTNEFSEFNGAGVVAPDISWNKAPGGGGTFGYIGVTQQQAFTVINSDISGSWGGSLTNISKSDLSGAKLPGSDPSLNMPFGYVDNLIDIPRNLDGKGIIIDPSNELFPDSKCGSFDYLDNSYLKANIIMRGTIDLSMNIAASLSAPIPFVSGDSCNDPSYNQFIGKFVQLVVDKGFNGGNIDFKPSVGVFYGIVKQICCLNPLVGPSGSIPWMDIHIELNNISNLDMLNALIKFKPQFRGINWATTPVNPLFPGDEAGPYAWGPLQLPWALFFYDSTSITTNALNTVRSVTVQGYFSDINFYMGSCINNLTQTNSFRDTYMSCLEDGTKNINFTKHNPVNYGTPPFVPAPPLPTNLSFNNSSTSTAVSPARPYNNSNNAYGINVSFTTAAPLTVNDIIELSFNYSDNSDFFFSPFQFSNGVSLAPFGSGLVDGYLVMGKALPTPAPPNTPSTLTPAIAITTDPTTSGKGNAKTANMLKIIIQEDIPTNQTIYIQLADSDGFITKPNPAPGTVATWGLSVSNHSPVTGLTAYTVTL